MCDLSTLSHLHTFTIGLRCKGRLVQMVLVWWEEVNVPWLKWFKFALSGCCSWVAFIHIMSLKIFVICIFPIRFNFDSKTLSWQTRLEQNCFFSSPSTSNVFVFQDQIWRCSYYSWYKKVFCRHLQYLLAFCLLTKPFSALWDWTILFLWPTFLRFTSRQTRHWHHLLFYYLHLPKRISPFLLAY